jgi:hypothetical protein
MPAFGQSDLNKDLNKTFKKYNLLRLDNRIALEKAKSEKSIEFQAYDRHFDFVLTPNDLRTAGYKAVEATANGDRALGRGEITTYKGKLKDDFSSEVRFTITENSIEGFIYTGDNKKFFVTKAEKFSKHAKKTDVVVYSEGDLMKSVDLSEDAHRPDDLESKLEYGLELLKPYLFGETESGEISAAAALEADLRAIEVATEADYQWVQQSGGASAANNEILGILNSVDAIYKRDLNLTIAVTYQHAWSTSDPYSTVSNQALLDSFLSYWNANYPRSQYPRDVAHLFTGKFSNQGIAYQGVTCRSAGYAYGVTARSGSVNHLITAHEIGHNLGADHVANSGTCANSLMNPSITSSATSFCDSSKSQIQNFVNTYGSCLTSTGTSTPTPTPTPTPMPTCTYSISPASQNFSSNGGTGSVNVTAPSHCSWSASSNQNFVSINSFGSFGNGVVHYTVAPNSGSSSRSASITIANQIFTVQQTGALPSSYTLSVSPSTVSPGGLLTVSWTATNTSPADWISLYNVGASSYLYGWWQYTNGAASGSFTLAAPTQPGQYEFRYMLNNSFTTVATSSVVTVQSFTSPTPTPTPIATPTPAPTPTVTPTPWSTPTPSPTPTTRTNVALASSGSTASASSLYPDGTQAAAAIDGSRVWAIGGAWKDATPDNYPDWLQIDFNSNRTINEIDVYAVKDDFNSTAEPTVNTTFSVYGITNFVVEYWNGSGWATVPNGNITNNNKVVTKISFSAITTTKIRIVVNNAQATYSRIVEVEAWSGGGVSPTPTPTATPTPTLTPTPTPNPTPNPTPITRSNVALASNGGRVSASSELYSGYPITSAIDGVRSWAVSGSWKDATPGNYPDWLQVDFNGSKTISEIDVYAVRDDYWNTAEPTQTDTVSIYGITSFEIQYWNGSGWTTVPNGNITNTNKAWTKVVFPALTTTKIRVVVNNAQDGYSRIVEVEAWTGGSSVIFNPEDEIESKKISDSGFFGTVTGLMNYGYKLFN